MSLSSFWTQHEWLLALFCLSGVTSLPYIRDHLKQNFLLLMSSLSPHYSATHEEAGCLVRTYGHRCWKTAHLSSSIIISQLASFPSSHLRLGRAGVYVHYTHVKLIALVGYKSVVLAQDFLEICSNPVARVSPSSLCCGS